MNIDLDGEIRGFRLLHVFSCHFKVADFKNDVKFGLEAVKLLLAASTVIAYGNQRRPTVLPRYEILVISASANVFGLLVKHRLPG
jgi:hypothetical protein